jgi:DNA-directed RNA polymerase subunit N (RpoN/RPB10)
MATIPMRCFNCGKMLSNKYNEFKKELEIKYEMSYNEIDDTKINGIQDIFEKLGYDRMCCRSTLMTTIDKSTTY